MNALNVIDVQNDSCPGGQLAMVDGDEIVDPINLMMEDFDAVVLTQDWHPSGHSSFASSHSLETSSAKKMFYGKQFLWPDHCVQGSSGAMFHSRLNSLRADLIIRKGYQAKIADLIQQKGMVLQKNEFEIRPNLEFSQGATLGFSGSTGIGNPHLHYEERNAQNQPIVPRNIGYIDRLPPMIRQIAFFNDNGRIIHTQNISHGKKNQVPNIAAKMAVEIVDYADTEDSGPMSIAELKVSGCGELLYHKKYTKITYDQMTLISEDLLGNHKLDWHYLGKQPRKNPNVLTPSKLKSCWPKDRLTIETSDFKGHTSTIDLFPSKDASLTPTSNLDLGFTSQGADIDSPRVHLQTRNISVRGELHPTLARTKIKVLKNKQGWQLLPRGLPWKKKFSLCMYDKTGRKKIFYLNSKNNWDIFSNQSRKGKQICAKAWDFQAVKLDSDTRAPKIISMKEKVLPMHGKQIRFLEIFLEDKSGFSSANQMIATNEHDEFTLLEWDFEEKRILLHHVSNELWIQGKDDFDNKFSWKLKKTPKGWDFND